MYAVMLLIVLAIAGFDRDLLALRRPRSWRARARPRAPRSSSSLFVAVTLLEPVLHGGEEQGLTPNGWEPDHAGAYVANFVVIAGRRARSSRS